MKKSTVVILTLTMLLFGSAQLAAARDDDMDINGLINRVQRQENQASQAAQRQAQRQANQLDNLKKRADKLIDNRIASLSRVLQRIQNDSKLSADEKSSLSAEVQTNISALNQLKAKIDADTDINTARADAKTIITSFKIFAVFEPKIRLLITIDNLSALSRRIAALTPKLQDLINNLKSQGKDVSKLQSLLDDISSNLSTINSKLAADKQTVLGISASSNPSAFAAVRQDLAAVRRDFAQIRHDIGQMRVEFQPAASPSHSPSPTSTSTL